MKKLLAKRGIMILYTLIVVSMLIILLTASMTQMQHSTFLTNKLEAETRAYWAAMAGLEYAQARIDGDIKWPSADTLYSGGVGNYDISEKYIAGCLVVHGVCREKDDEFYIAFGKSVSGNSIVPSPLPADESGKPLKLYSFNGINPADGKSSIADMFLEISKIPSHVVQMPKAGGVYIAVEGRNRNYVCNLEKIFQARLGADKYSAALYVGKEFDGYIRGKFAVSDNGGRNPNVITVDGFTIQSSSPLEGANALNDIDTAAPPDNLGNGPVSMHGGAIFTKKPTISLNSVKLVTGNPANLRNYGVRVEPAGSIELPKITIPQPAASSVYLPGGNYTFVERPKSLPSPFEDLCQRLNLPSFDYTPKKSNISAVGEKDYEFMYFPTDFSPNSFTVEKFQKGRIMVVIDDILKKLEGSGGGILGAVVDVLTQPVQWPIEAYRKVIKNELNGEMFEIDNGKSKFYAFKPNDKPLNKNALSESPFKIRNDMLAMTITDNVQVSSGDFVFATSEVDMNNYSSGKYRQAVYARSSVMLGEKNVKDRVMLYSDASIDIKGFLAGKGEVVGKNNISIEAGGKLDAEGENEIAMFAHNDLNIKYVSATFAKYYAPHDVRDAAQKVPLPFDLANLPEISSKKYKDYVKNLLSQTVSSGKTLKEMLKSYGITSETGYNTPETYIYELMSRDPASLNPVSGQVSESSAYSPFVPTSNIRGVLYAKNNIVIEPSQGDVSLEGIVVCEGSMKVYDANNFSIRYDPSLSSISVALPQGSYMLSQLLFNKF